MAALLVHIRAVHAETKGEYGWPRVWEELLARGVRVGKERVQKLVQLAWHQSASQAQVGPRPTASGVNTRLHAGRLEHEVLRFHHGIDAAIAGTPVPAGGEPLR